MIEVYNSNLKDRAKEILFKFYVEAVETGQGALSNEIFNKLKDMDEHDREIKLTEQRKELDNLINGQGIRGK